MTQQKPNYRIYDETGGGVTHDIYAKSLDDAIKEGREWIEEGDWNSSDDGVYRTITLECSVREIVRYPVPDAEGKAVWHDGTKLHADEDGDLIDDDGLLYCTAADCGEIDEDATNDGDRHDCSGTFADEIPACELSEDGEHDWRSPISLVGGIRGNPGFWSGGGTITISKSVCACCGQYRTETDKGSQCHPSEAKLVTEIEPADDASKAWLMRRLNLPDEIEIAGATVTLEWDESGDITDDDSVLGQAIHTVPSADLDEGTADGPSDGETFFIGGVEFRLGSHDYETNDDQTTCTAAIYRVLQRRFD